MKHITMTRLCVLAVLMCLMLPQLGLAQGDPSAETVLVGSQIVDLMRIKLELEPAKGMWMKGPMGWMEMLPGPGDPYHLEVKLEDPYSNTRISNSDISLSVTKIGGGAPEDYLLHPMWGGSGLHYAVNGHLAGDGTYLVTVTANPPTMARGTSNKDLWLDPISADFEFSFAGGLITSAPVVLEPNVPPLPAGDPKAFHVVVGEGDDAAGEIGVKVEFEDAATMYMLMMGMWMEMPVPAGSIHLEVKLTDLVKASHTRISYSEVSITLLDTNTLLSDTYSLHEMWGGSGLHYGVNAVVAPGDYLVTVDAGVPEFARGLSDSNLFMDPVHIEFGYTHVPEPLTVTLLITGGMCLLRRRSRKR